MTGLFDEGLLDENATLDPDGLVSFPLVAAAQWSVMPLTETDVASSKERLKLCKPCSGNSSRGDGSKASGSLWKAFDTVRCLVCSSPAGFAVAFASCRRSLLLDGSVANSLLFLLEFDLARCSRRAGGGFS